MDKKHKTYSNENNVNDGYCDYQGGYNSCNPSQLTKHYTVKGFEGKIKSEQTTKSKWC